MYRESEHIFNLFLVNKFQHAHFTTKIGIHSALENLYWFTNNTMHSFFPRCYQVKHFSVWLRNRIMSARVNRFSAILKHHVYHRITDNFFTNIKNEILTFINPNKTGFKLCFHFNNRAKLSIIRCGDK